MEEKIMCECCKEKEAMKGYPVCVQCFNRISQWGTNAEKQRMKYYYQKELMSKDPELAKQIREKRNQYQKQYYQKNREKLIQYKKQYNKEHPNQKFAEYQKKYIANNREKWNAYQRQYQKRKREEIKAKLARLDELEKQLAVDKSSI